jgi:hypothetical protein
VLQSNVTSRLSKRSLRKSEVRSGNDGFKIIKGRCRGLVALKVVGSCVIIFLIFFVGTALMIRSPDFSWSLTAPSTMKQYLLQMNSRSTITGTRAPPNRISSKTFIEILFVSYYGFIDSCLFIVIIAKA